jgi:hypothetical protein
VQPNTQTTTGGSYCAVTGNAPSASSALGTNDVDAGITTLESPVYNLTSFTNPIFTYNRWYINNPPSGANPGNDSWEVHVTNDGSTWTKIERTNVSDKSWRRVAFRVKDYVTLTPNVQFRFMAADSIIPGANLDGGSLVEAAVDDLKLYEEGMVGVEEDEEISQLSMYPNPATTEISISFSQAGNEDVTLIVVDNIGRQVFSKVLKGVAGEQQLRIETSGFAAGIYQLNVRTAGKDHIRKFAVMK